MKTFLVTGYPRSRTAWCANFLSYGPSYCFHEPIAHTPISAFPELLKRAESQYVGISDCGAVGYLDWFMKRFPETRIVLIKRDRADVIKSMERLGFDFRSTAGTFEASFLEIEKRYEVLTVPFGALPATEIWQHCVPGQPVNQMRLQMLENFRIELLDHVLKGYVKDIHAKVGRPN